MRVAVAVAVVAEVTSGSWNAEEATCADARADVVGDMVDMHLT